LPLVGGVNVTRIGNTFREKVRKKKTWGVVECMTLIYMWGGWFWGGGGWVGEGGGGNREKKSSKEEYGGVGGCLIGRTSSFSKRDFASLSVAERGRSKSRTEKFEIEEKKKKKR